MEHSSHQQRGKHRDDSTAARRKKSGLARRNRSTGLVAAIAACSIGLLGSAPAFAQEDPTAVEQPATAEVTPAPETPQAPPAEKVEENPTPAPVEQPAEPVVQDPAAVADPAEGAVEEVPPTLPEVPELGLMKSEVSALLVPEVSVMAAVTPPQSGSGNGRLRVTKRGDRDGTSDTIKPLNGALFVAVQSNSNDPNSVAVPTPAQIAANPTSYYYCTTGEGSAAGTPGQCTINVPTTNSPRYWVFEIEAPSGFGILNEIALGTISTGSTPSTTTKYRYAFRTGQVTNGDTIDVPGTSTASDSSNTTGVPHISNSDLNWRTRSGGWADVRDSGSFPEVCGVKVAMVFDISSSISTTGNPSEMTQMLNAGKSFVSSTNGLGGTPTTVSVFRFGSTASQVSVSGVNTPVSIATTTGINQATSLIDAVNNRGSSTQYTNWDDALRKVSAAGPWDVVLFMTDGDPTRSGTASGNGTAYINLRYLEDAIASANNLKSQTGPKGKQTYILPVGVGMAANSIVNLNAISGDGVPVQANDFAALSTTLRDIALRNCGGQLSVSKVVQNENGETLPLDPNSVGWEFTAAGGATNPSSTKTTDTSGGVSFPINFGAPVQNQTLTVSETQKDGYTFVGATCTNAAVIGTPSNGSLQVSVAPGTIASCVFTNKEVPKKGSITVTKVDKDSTATKLAGAKFQLWNDVNSNGTLETDTDTKVGVEQTTALPAGTASWTDLVLGKYLVQETTAPPGYELSAPAVQAFTLDATHLSLSATFENPRKKGTAAWKKVDDQTPANALGGSKWTLTGTGVPAGTIVEDCTTANCPAGQYKDQDPDPGEFLLTELTWGTYTLTESEAPQGYQLGTPPATFTFPIDATHLSYSKTDPVKNVRVLGKAKWVKEDQSGNLLAGSKWTLTGPGATAGVIVEDCTSTCASGAFKDQDPAPGKFLIEGLAWGDYTLVEQAAPPGYILDTTPHPFAVTASSVSTVVNVGTFENTPITPPTIPLTGGLGRDFYTLSGFGVLALAAAVLGAMRIRKSRREAV